VDAAAVLLLNPHTQVLEYAKGRGFLTRRIEDAYLRLGEGYAGQAAWERRLIEVHDLPNASPPFVRGNLVEAEGFVAYRAIPLIAKGQVKGVLEVFHRTPLEVGPDWTSFFETLGAQAAIAIDNASLYNDLQRSHTDLALAYDNTLEGWARALELRDRETEGHTRRVTETTERLAITMGVAGESLVHIRRGALLHDIGKMGVPDSILLKPGKLTDDEWRVMRLHPQLAYDMLSPIAYLRPAIDIPYCHHEKWDGTGYPRGLKGEQIPLAARVFAVVDVYDALTSDRPYRLAWSAERAIEYIRQQAGKHFDPQIVEKFPDILKP
jgi:HD-GYP domain-containing protein (c-di-GMP phosphodiesterase class II)